MDKIILVPILFIIMINIVFLLVIVYVLLAKLKLTTPREFERFSRGLRALFVLCPLLGVNYAIVLVQPTSPSWLSLVVTYYSVIVSSLQGLLVAIFFCFKNKEVGCLCKVLDVVIVICTGPRMFVSYICVVQNIFEIES